MANLKNVISSIYKNFLAPGGKPGGNVLQNQASSTVPLPNPPVPNQKLIQKLEPYGSVPHHRTARASGWSQIQNLSTNLDITKVQAALRAAERGDTTLLFTYYRDLFLGTSPVAYELSKRKLAVLSEPYNIIPCDKNNPDDVIACEVIKDMIDNTQDWNDNLIHLMNAIIFPLAISEKIFKPVDPKSNKYGIRYRLEKLFPVSWELLCFRLPYLPSGPINTTNQPVNPIPPLIQSTTGRAQDTTYDVDTFEPDLRFWSTFDSGLIDYSWGNIYAPDPNRHLIYRSNLLGGVVNKDNFGGLGRTILFWAIMAQQGKEIFFRLLSKWGLPYIVAKVDTSQIDTVNMISEAFENQNVINSLIVNKDAEIMLQEINLSGAAEGHKMFIELCNEQISLLISGITLASNVKATGMGSGTADLQSTVRNDIVRFDRLMLGNCLRYNLFKQYLEINGINGNPPKIVWGGSTSSDAKLLSETINNLALAGISPSEESLENLSERLGFIVEKSNPTVDPNNKQSNVDNDKDNDKDKEL